jgi:hypothetical protein
MFMRGGIFFHPGGEDLSITPGSKDRSLGTPIVAGTTERKMTLGVHVSVRSRIETAVRAISGEREDFGPLRPRKIAYGVIVRRGRVIICKRGRGIFAAVVLFRARCGAGCVGDATAFTVTDPAFQASCGAGIAYRRQSRICAPSRQASPHALCSFLILLCAESSQNRERMRDKCLKPIQRPDVAVTLSGSSRPRYSEVTGTVSSAGSGTPASAW